MKARVTVRVWDSSFQAIAEVEIIEEFQEKTQKDLALVGDAIQRAAYNALQTALRIHAEKKPMD